MTDRRSRGSRDATGSVALCESGLRWAIAARQQFEIVQWTIQSTLALLRVGRVDDAARLPVVDSHGLTAAGKFNAATASGMLAFVHPDCRARTVTDEVCYWEGPDERGPSQHC